MKTYNLVIHSLGGFKAINNQPLTYEACKMLAGMLGLKGDYWIHRS